MNWNGHSIDDARKKHASDCGRPEQQRSVGYPKELSALGIKEYRQTLFKPFRVIYRVRGGQVIIYLIADGRRDMQSVLAGRLLGG